MDNESNSINNKFECEYCKSDLFAHPKSIRKEIDKILSKYKNDDELNYDDFFENEPKLAHKLGSLLQTDINAYNYTFNIYEGLLKKYKLEPNYGQYYYIRTQYIKEYNDIALRTKSDSDIKLWYVCNQLCNKCEKTSCPFHTKYGDFKFKSETKEYVCGWCDMI